MTAPAQFPEQAISQTRLGDEVADRIRRFIVANELSDGARLPSERALAEKLGTSRATVSQALRMLAVMGLVDIRHGSGVYVRHDPGSMMGASLDLMVELEPGSVEELAGFRHWLEQAIVNGSEPKAFDADRLAIAFDALVDSAGVMERWIEADAAFHVALVSALGNRYLATAYETAHRKVLTVTYAEWVEKGATPRWLRGRAFENQIDLHRRILEAALAGDRPALMEALSGHQGALQDHLERATQRRDEKRGRGS